MTTTEAPTSHLRENPYDLAKRQLGRVGEVFGIDRDLIGVLSQCKKSVEVSIPVAMDDGTVRVFEGYRVTHNVARGRPRAEFATTPRSRATRSRRWRCG